MMEPLSHDPKFEAPGIEELRPLFPAYEIEGFLAKGGMGALYFGRQSSLDRPVAIKILPREFGADAQFRAHFESEAKSMARLNHPNLIGVYDFGEADGYLFIIMELVEGESLHSAAHGSVVEEKEAAHLVAGICQGLAHAHQHGILHRDIKPENILLAPGPQPKIVDFGLARPMGEGPEPDEVIYGTPGYAAPEVVNSPGAVDHRADVFSAGVVLYELLTGQMPPTPWMPPSSLSNCNGGFDSIARRAAHPSPEMRYGDAAEMAEELEKLVARLEGPFAGRPGGPVEAHPGLKRPRVSAVAGTVSPIVPAARKSSPGPLVAVAVVILGLAAVAYYFATAGRTESPPIGGGEPVAPAPVPEPIDPPVPSDPGPRHPVAVVPADPPVPDDLPAPAPEPAPKPPETSAESLARLQTQLRSGDRSELPKGTISRGDSHFLLGEPSVSWDVASRFAESHGAQLAVLDSGEDFKWAVEQFAIKEPVWLGLSDSGTEGKWHWVDGSPATPDIWAAGQPDNTPSEDDGEDFAVLLPDGILDDEPASNERRFVLQWANEGENIGSLANQLRRVGESLKAKEVPVFPAGSRNIGGSRFLVVPTATSWEAASSAAKAAGGHLAVPSNNTEAAWIVTNMRRHLDPGEGCWVGGRRSSGATPRWNFVTAESFEFVEWVSGQPDGEGESEPVLRLWKSDGESGAMGYDDAAPTDPGTVCFILEWSAPSRRNMPGKDLMDQPKNARDWLLAHREKTAADHGEAHKKFRKAWDKNLEDFTEGVRNKADFGGRGGRGGGGFSRMADNYAEEIEKEGRIPESVPGFAERLIGDLHKEALEKQNEIEQEYEPQFLAALERYLEDIRLMAARILRTGQRDDAAYLAREETATSADHQRFRQILDGMSPPVPDE